MKNCVLSRNGSGCGFIVFFMIEHSVLDLALATNHRIFADVWPASGSDVTTRHPLTHHN